MPPVMKWTVWAMASLLVQATVVPTLTVSVAGMNAKLTMPTTVADAGARVAPVTAPRGVAGAGAAGALGVGFDLVRAALAPQAASVTVLTAASAAIRRRVHLGFCVGWGLARVGSTLSLLVWSSRVGFHEREGAGIRNRSRPELLARPVAGSAPRGRRRYRAGLNDDLARPVADGD